MKKEALITCFWLLTAFALRAQLTPPKSVKQKAAVKTQSHPGLEAEPTRTQPVQPAPTSASYSLSSVKVNIRTGSDNKEALSNVSIELAVRNAGYQVFAQHNNTNQMRAGSNTIIGLEKSSSYISGYHPNTIPTTYYTAATGTQSIMLSDIEKYGLSLRIIYKPNFFADAWEIENVSATLEFKDASGKLHPTSGQKTITFSNAATFLDNFDKRMLVCTADNYFSPLTSFVTKDLSKRW